jgi:hypothetical protein
LIYCLDVSNGMIHICYYSNDIIMIIDPATGSGFLKPENMPRDFL